ncbi:MAG: GNAT family N-acetyltransferase [Geminicoccaceae bacterium]
MSAARCGLQQGWSYGEAMRASGVGVHRLVVRDGTGRPLACAQIAERRLGGLWRAGFLLRGPVWLCSPSPDFEPVILAGVRRQLRGGPLLWAPECATTVARHPVMTGYSTSWLDLDPGPDPLLAGCAADWRNGLRRAERRALTVSVDGGPDEVGWLLDRNEAYRRQVGYRGPSRSFLGRLAAAAAAVGDLLVLVAYLAAEPVAGILIVRHGSAATYEVGYVSRSGRDSCATHLLLWRAVDLLARAGVRWLDLGGLATDRAPGIARFKLGLGGEVATLPGTYLMRGPL